MEQARTAPSTSCAPGPICCHRRHPHQPLQHDAYKHPELEAPAPSNEPHTGHPSRPPIRPPCIPAGRPLLRTLLPPVVALLLLTCLADQPTRAAGTSTLQLSATDVRNRARSGPTTSFPTSRPAPPRAARALLADAAGPAAGASLAAAQAHAIGTGADGSNPAAGALVANSGSTARLAAGPAGAATTTPAATPAATLTALDTPATAHTALGTPATAHTHTNATHGPTGASGAGPAAGPKPAFPFPLELPASAADFAACFTAAQPPHPPGGTSWGGAMADAPPSLRLLGLWWSNRSADVPLTLTTQLSWNRKWQLKAMCRSWPGPIAAAMHVPVLLPRLTGRQDATLDELHNNTIAAAVSKVADFYARMEAHGCKLDLALLAEGYREAKALVLYPVNLLRNVARLMARTPLVGLVDVDLVVSASLHAEMADPRVAARYVTAAAAGASAGAAGSSGGNGTAAVQGAAVAAAGEGPIQGPGWNGTGAGGARRALRQAAAGAGGAGGAGGGAADLGGSGGTGAAGGAAEPAGGAAAGRGASAAVPGGSATLPSPPRRPVLWVLPAFETHGGKLPAQVARAERLAKASKAELREAFQGQKVQRFDHRAEGHLNTNYSRWFAARRPYTVQWSPRYEPWVIVDRLTAPWADARFRGYGKNKIVHLRSFQHAGYEFRVHPAAYLLHRPHGGSGSKHTHATNARRGRRGKDASMYGHNNHLYKQVKAEMAAGNYTPALDPATAACRHALSWWRPAAAPPPHDHPSRGHQHH